MRLNALHNRTVVCFFTAFFLLSVSQSEVFADNQDSLPEVSTGELIHFDLPEGPATEVFKKLGKTVNKPVMYRADEVEGIHLKPLKGDMSLQDAMRIIEKDTALKLSVDQATGAILVTVFPKASAQQEGVSEPNPNKKTNTETNKDMKSVNKSIVKTIMTCLTFGLFVSQIPLHSQQVKESQIIELETFIVTGTRLSNRTVSDSIHPIDLVPVEDLSISVSAELTDVLVQNIPSFNVQRAAMNDGLIFVRPARLRGLSPDHTLVMVNGKRFHRSALLGDNGAQGADLAQIATNAIGHVEVLRDGASAQYGSDAIAGAINILLNNEPGYHGFTQVSQFFEGDGQDIQFGFSAGWNINDKGFFGISAFRSDSEYTSRSRQRPDAIEYQEAHPELDIPNPVQNWGQPDREVIQLSMNSYYRVSVDLEMYAFGTFGQGDGWSDFNWRNPGSAMFNETESFPGWSLRDVYPTGFSPKFGQDDEDYQFYAGIRDAIGPFTWDLSAGRGRNEIDYKMENTINASMGPDSPTTFNPGTLIQAENTFNFDATYWWESGFSTNPINIAFGAEHRTETYEIQAGDEPSYKIGEGATVGLPSSSNGFPGYSPEQAGEWDQSSSAGYLDVEWNPTSLWNIELAGRYEDYESFGSNADYKVASRIEILESLALRGAVSTGFRAPTPGQIYSTRTSQGLDSTTLEVYTAGRLSPLNPVSIQFGAKPLEPETSTNISGGLVWNIQEHSILAVDYYQIEVSNRFGVSSNYTVTDEIKENLAAAGVSGADSFTSINFYTNDYDTKTTGIDITFSQLFVFEDSQLHLSVAFNHNKTEVIEGSLTANPDAKRVFEENLPKNAGNISLKYTRGNAQISTRMRYFGDWTDYSGNSDGQIFQEFGSMCLFDLTMSYQFENGLGIRLGAENLFNSYPDEATRQANRGLIYPRTAPYSTDGGRWFARLDYTF
jgi:iron complex outermembrane recepter protein